MPGSNDPNLDAYNSMITPDMRKMIQPAEPSTEGTQAAQPQFGFFRCLSCGFNGTISTDEIAKHRAQCSHGPTVPMSQAEWEARGEPAPVAQVDAGKCHHIWGWDRVCMACGEDSLEPAVAQTELPSVSQVELKIPDSRLREMVSGMDGLTPADCADTKEIDAMVPELISLRERIARLEAREAELKAEIAKMQMDNVIDYKAACEQHAANYEALERSHAKLRKRIQRLPVYPHHTWHDNELIERQKVLELLAAAEKL